MEIDRHTIAGARGSVDRLPLGLSASQNLERRVDMAVIDECALGKPDL